MALDAAMNAALGAHTIRSFMAIRVELPDNLTINLITGSGFVTFPVDGVPTTFTSKDAIFGVLSSVSSCLLYTSPSPRDGLLSRMPSSA